MTMKLASYLGNIGFHQSRIVNKNIVIYTFPFSKYTVGHSRVSLEVGGNNHASYAQVFISAAAVWRAAWHFSEQGRKEENGNFPESIQKRTCSTLGN